LQSKPFFYRRRVALAQAGLISRCLIQESVGIDSFCEWMRKQNSHLFYYQALIDLRSEQRWQPNYVEPQPLKQQLLTRIYGAALSHKDTLQDPALEVLFGEADDNLQAQFYANLAAAAAEPFSGQY
jgi:hypothetical protein